MKTVVIGMSGGVDSSVAAIMLKKAGYNGKRIYMRNDRGRPCGRGDRRKFL